MIGTAIVMEPAEFENWLALHAPTVRWRCKAVRSFSSIAA